MARKILLADDSVTAQNMGRRILMDAGYEVLTVNNGSAALKRIAEAKPDLIVLDVYMPGYGGLEVCQRIRESSDTARIPVLLTVGKLEPFKPEEVRRVRADAFIVKPFEASELLTALTKLEDKIVPQPAPYKPGRFAKAVAAIEESAFPSNEYGDLEKGWKNRIKIPPPHAPKPHAEEAEQETEATHPTTAPEAAPNPTAAMLREVTVEEIAAIEAAVAAVRGHSERPVSRWEEASESSVSGEHKSSSSSPAHTDDDAPVTFAAAPSLQDEPSSEPTAEHASTDQVPEPAPEIVTPAVEAVSAQSNEDEVTAALAALAPAGEPSQALHSVSAFSGPRWIAQIVSVGEEDVSLDLNEEMQKALAVVAAADALQRQQVPPHLSGELREANYTSDLTTSDSTQIRDASPAGVNAQESPLPAEPASTSEQEAAYAAAASSGSDAVSSTIVDALPSSEISDVQPTAERDYQRESELAEAWSSWKKLRDSGAGSDLASQLANAATENFIANSDDQPAQGTPSESHSEAPEDSGAIASIVDSVLAELKPKLMQEIARKMKK